MNVKSLALLPRMAVISRLPSLLTDSNIPEFVRIRLEFLVSPSIGIGTTSGIVVPKVDVDALLEFMLSKVSSHKMSLIVVLLLLLSELSFVSTSTSTIVVSMWLGTE